MKPLTFWERAKRGVRDRSFIIGSVLVSFFILVAVLGPELAPHNPYLRDRVQTIDGELQRAPFPPSDIYPLGTDDQGRDMLSMLLHGTRQTLVIAFVAMTVRLLLGLILGTVSGWWSGSAFDRGVTTLIEFMAAIPGLILAILLVLAVGIKRGQIAFIVALSLVGWGEVTQIVRGHVLTLRNKLFILASRSLGLNSVQVLSRHVLPNLLSTLLALAALEMGGVLLLLGELGFVNIFVGGGGMYVDEGVQMGHAVHYFDVPDWGAMLGTSWRQFRVLPWLPLAPALAFFISILGFNLFGYGLQRFIEKGRFHPSGWSVLRFFIVIAILLFGARSLLASSGIEANFAELVQSFDVQSVWNDIGYLTQPKLEGRPSGPGAGFEAASYIAYQFEQAGLTTLTNGTYYQTFPSVRGRVTSVPSLAVLGPDSKPYLHLEEAVTFNPRVDFNAQGTRESNLVVMANVPDHVALDYVTLMLDPDEGVNVPWNYQRLGKVAVLRVVPDDVLGGRERPPFLDMHHGFMRQYPRLLIGETAARKLLDEAGLDLDDLRERMETGEKIQLETDLQVRLDVGLIYEDVTAVNVIGYFPAADVSTGRERILVTAYYSGPLPREGVMFPGADENASGVAIMLEVARLWHDLDFQPKRTVVFAALDARGGNQFVNSPVFPLDTSDTWIAVSLQGLGAGEDYLARLATEPGLSRAFDQSAKRFGVRTEELDSWHFFFMDSMSFTGYYSSDRMYSGVVLARPGDERSGTPADTMDHLDPEELTEIGQAVAHYLMVLSAR